MVLDYQVPGIPLQEQSDILCNMETKTFLLRKEIPEKVNNMSLF